MHHIAQCDQCGRPEKGRTGSWCEVPPNCTSFVWDDMHVRGPELNTSLCSQLPCDAVTYCYQGGPDLWAATTTPAPAPHSPCPTPQPPPIAPSPVFHLPARCEEGDVNALFQFNGRWHVMQQWHARPATSIGHAVSEDLLHFTRVPDVLTSGQSGDEQCYDGSSSIVTINGQVTPFLMIDGGCGMKGPGNMGCMESSGNGSTGGVTAVPEDLTDPYLTNWSRRGPTVFHGCDGSAGPSPILINPATSAAELIAIHQHGEALFRSQSSDFTEWTMVNGTFLPARGGGGGLWHVLPQNVDGVDDSRWASHIMQVDSSSGDGGPTFSLMKIDSETMTVTNLSAAVPIDMGKAVKYGQLSSYGGTANIGAQGDLRTIHVSWLTTSFKGQCNIANIHESQLTVFRDLRFDPRVGPIGSLVETPIQEYFALRGSVLNQTQGHFVASTQPAPVLFLPHGPTAADIELNISISTGMLTLGFACSHTNLMQCGMSMQLEISGQNVTMTVPEGKTVFPLFDNETIIPLRVMIDTRSIEIFAGFGRGVYSTSLDFSNCEQASCAIAADSSTGTAAIDGVAWSMNAIQIKTAQP